MSNPLCFSYRTILATAALSTNKDGVRGITATINRKVKVFVFEASIRRHLKLEGSEGLKTLPTVEIFKQLAPMGVDIPLFLTMLTTPKSSPSKITSSPSLSPQTHSSTSQPPSTPPSNQTTPVTEEATLMPHESPLQSVHSLGRDKGSLSLNELTDLCTSLSKKVESLESELNQSRRRAKVVISDDEEAEEDPSNQGRSLIEELDLDAGISLVPPHAADQGRIDDTQISDQPKEQLGVLVQLQLLQMQLEEDKVLKMFKLTPEEEENTTGVKAKDKGKAIMHESEPLKKIKKKVQVQMSVDEELAKKLDEREEVAAKFDQAHDIYWSDPAVLRYHTSK
ncbi:hypothetical protein Tco_0476088 [Tanacetum coccineum]